ncbi:MAG: DEAD/DEAH box helicase [Nitriliruptorales bacterium]|nr:DEAD/DEAH box helicase [Nitriliruptorales bacterium]
MDSQALLHRLDEEFTAALPAADRRPRLTHVQRLPARRADLVDLPDDLPSLVADRLRLAGLDRLYRHQAEALEHVRAGRHVVVATGTASGKSLCYQLPLLERLLTDDKATALYLAPTKALANDQLRALRAFRLPHIRAATYDGDTPAGEREAIRRTANVVLTNPDMLHAGLLPGHRRWGDFLHRLALVVVDECHVARGVFGSHVAAILRRLRRLCAYYSTPSTALLGRSGRTAWAGGRGRGAGGSRDGLAEDPADDLRIRDDGEPRGAGTGSPCFVFASATIGNAGEHARNLSGLDVVEVVRDGSPKPPVTFGLWEPPLGDTDQGGRRSTLAESADLLAGLIQAQVATLAFVRSRKGAEVVATQTRRLLAPAGLDDRVMAYRAGYLASERRAVERGLQDGSLYGVATTDALELGMDVGTLDAVIIAGWPGTLASLWQQAGRAGRRGQEAVVTFVADDNPLDHYLLSNPDQLWGRPLESAVVDLTNPYILLPHLRCAAWELPLDAEEEVFGTPGGPRPDVAGHLDGEVGAGRLRERGGRFYWSGRGSPAAGVSIRSAGGSPFQIVDGMTGALIGDVDESRAYRTVHEGAVYLHQGQSYRIERLDLRERVAVARMFTGDEYTQPRSDTDISVLAVTESVDWGRCRFVRGRVEVSNRVLAYERRRLSSGESLGIVELDLPPLHLVTQALWLTIPSDVLAVAGIDQVRVPGAAHAAEHAAIGLLPLFAMCDRWDIGGVSTAWHPDTGLPTIFIYDGYPGGAGITERGFRSDDAHLRATLSAIHACQCATGCPSCVQSPKCGNGNEPLDKAGAVALLRAVLTERASGLRQPAPA